MTNQDARMCPTCGEETNDVAKGMEGSSNWSPVVGLGLGMVSTSYLYGCPNGHKWFAEFAHDREERGDGFYVRTRVTRKSGKALP